MKKIEKKDLIYLRQNDINEKLLKRIEELEAELANKKDSNAQNKRNVLS